MPFSRSRLGTLDLSTRKRYRLEQERYYTGYNKLDGKVEIQDVEETTHYSSYQR